MYSGRPRPCLFLFSCVFNTWIMVGSPQILSTCIFGCDIDSCNCPNSRVRICLECETTHNRKIWLGKYIVGVPKRNVSN
jgi:hypothetical protein